MFLMINNTLAQFISICECMFDTLVWLKFHKELFDFNEDVYMCCAYIPPSNSSHHALYDCFVFLKTVLLHILQKENLSRWRFE